MCDISDDSESADSDVGVKWKRLGQIWDEREAIRADLGRNKGGFDGINALRLSSKKT